MACAHYSNPRGSADISLHHSDRMGTLVIDPPDSLTGAPGHPHLSRALANFIEHQGAVPRRADIEPLQEELYLLRKQHQVIISKLRIVCMCVFACLPRRADIEPLQEELYLLRKHQVPFVLYVCVLACVCVRVCTRL